MAPIYPSDRNNSANGSAVEPGPHPSFIQIAKRYMFEEEIQECMAAIGATEGKEDTVRLQGVAWIDNVRKALQLPVRTYNTASVYYHKFRLVHKDSEYDYRDAAAAALFNACKIEDTLKKSRDILCAAYNMKLPASEQLSSDDHIFESHAKTIVGLERLMLEASGFDFRNRYPQKILIKLVKSCSLAKESVGLKSYSICLDLYRTYAPLKQTTQTMAMSCLELAARLCEVDLASITSDYGFDYDKWATSREEIMETLLDLLDLYIHHRTNTHVGPEHSLDTFIQIRITLNQEASGQGYPRYTVWRDKLGKGKNKEAESSKKNGRVANGSTSTPHSESPQSPADVSTATTTTPGDRGKEGTVRFMLDPGRARDEKTIVKEYFRSEEVEEEIELYLEENFPYFDQDMDDSSQQYSPPPAISIPSTDSSFETPEYEAPYIEKTTLEETEKENERGAQQTSEAANVEMEYKTDPIDRVYDVTTSKSESMTKYEQSDYTFKFFKPSYIRDRKNFPRSPYQHQSGRSRIKGRSKVKFESELRTHQQTYRGSGHKRRSRGGHESYTHDTKPPIFPPKQYSETKYDSRSRSRLRESAGEAEAGYRETMWAERQHRYNRHSTSHSYTHADAPLELFPEKTALKRQDHLPHSCYEKIDSYEKAYEYSDPRRSDSQLYRGKSRREVEERNYHDTYKINPTIHLDHPVYESRDERSNGYTRLDKRDIRSLKYE